MNGWNGLGSGYRGFEGTGRNTESWRRGRKPGLWPLLIPFGILIFLRGVPFIPYEPGCWTSWSRRVPLPVMEVAADYREEVAKQFKFWGIPTINTEKELLVPPWSAAGSADFDFDAVLSATEPRITAGLIKWIVITPPGTVSPSGYIYRSPDIFKSKVGRTLPKKEEIEDIDFEQIQRDCALAMAVLSAENWRLSASEEVQQPVR